MTHPRNGPVESVRALPRAIVLDFDGTVLESEAIKTAVFEEVASRFPEHLATFLTYHEAHRSLGRVMKFTYLVEVLLRRPGDRWLIEELTDHFARRVSERLAEAPLVAGARDFLAEYAPQVPIYLASVTPEAELVERVERHGLRPYFVRIYGDPPTKKETAVALVVGAHGGDPRRVLLVGDSPSDLRVAEAIGAEFIPRDSGMSFPPGVGRPRRDLSEVAAQLRSRSVTGR